MEIIILLIVNIIMVCYTKDQMTMLLSNECNNTVLSIRAGSRPKQPSTGQCLAGYFCLTPLLILVINLKLRKRSNKKDVRLRQTSELKQRHTIFRSFKRVYLSHA